MALEANLESQSATKSGMLHLAASQWSSYGIGQCGRERLSLCNKCSLCGKDTETVKHPFLHCNFTDQLLQIFLNLRGISWSMPSKIDETLFSWKEAGVGATNKERWRMILACIWWTIWRERNDRCFENRDNNLQEVKLKCLLLFCFWCTNVYSNETESIIDGLGSI